MIPTCLTLSIIRYVSRVKCSNPGEGVAPSLHFVVVAFERGAFGLPTIMVADFIFTLQTSQIIDTAHLLFNEYPYYAFDL